MPRPQRKTKKYVSYSIAKVSEKTIKKKSVGNFVCCLCNKTYKIKKSYHKHMAEAHNTKQENLKAELGITEIAVKKRSLPCKLCPKKFKFLENYKKHLQLEHSTVQGSIACKQCTVRCPNEELLEEHVKKAHEKGEFSCERCGQTFVRNYHVIRHLEQSGCDKQTSKIFECEICLVKFTRKDNLLVHLRTHLAKKFTCKHCPFMAMKFNKYVRHVQEEHMEQKFECDVCGKVLGSRGAITKHLEIHGDKKYACEVCNYQTYTIEVMKRHVLRHTADKPYRCALCAASFIQMSQLRRHTANKHDGFKCELCDEAFSSAALLNKHFRNKTHSGLEGLQCPFPNCSLQKVQFSSMDTLKEHMTTHIEKEYNCEVCSKSFRSELTLRSHVRTHWLERPRRCMYCVNARAYIRGDMLLRHVRMKHPPVFQEHLAHVREVLGVTSNEQRVTKSEMSSVLSLLDAVAERILEQSGDGRVLYAGMQDEADVKPQEVAEEPGPLLSEQQLADNLKQLLARLIDADTLQCFGWPDESVDEILEKVIEQCGQTPADRARWSRVQCLRENAKHLFLHVVEDKVVGRMLATHTIDQVVTHLLKVSAADDDEEPAPEQQEEGRELVVEFATY